MIKIDIIIPVSSRENITMFLLCVFVAKIINDKKYIRNGLPIFS